MIPVKPPLEPPEFREKVELPGKSWLAEHPDAKRPHPYWLEVRAQLAQGFRHLCAYSAMYEPVGTVDHFVSWDEDHSKAYDWSNYRFASGWLNSSKRTLKASQVLDPFEVQSGWFEVELPSLELVASGDIPEVFRERATTMLSRLRLGTDERVLKQREEWYRMYQDHELTLDGLEKKAPLIAAAIRKLEQNKCASDAAPKKEGTPE